MPGSFLGALLCPGIHVVGTNHGAALFRGTHPFDFSIQVPTSFLEVFQVLRGVLPTGAADVFQGIPEMEVEFLVFDEFDDLDFALIIMAGMCHLTS